MANFPTPRQIVEDLNGLQPFIKQKGDNPRQGEVDAAQYVYDLAQKFGLGNARIVPLPNSPRFSPYTAKDPKLGNVVIEAGTGNDELLILHGHLDLVPPKDYRGKSHDIVQGQDGILKGLGSYDMLPGVAAILTALRDMTIDHRRRVRAVIVCGEENDSEGTHAAFDHSDNLFAFPGGNRVALSTEITVGANLGDPDHLVVGRPGRFTYDMIFEGLMEHTGEVEAKSFLRRSTIQRLAAIERAVVQLEFPPHPDDMDSILRAGQAALQWGGALDPQSLSTSGEGEAKCNVHYANPNLTAAEIQGMLRIALRKVLRDDNFLVEKTERTVPWLRPWLENLGEGSFARKIQHVANQIAASRPYRKQQHVGFRGGKGVADENIIGQEMPTVCVPPRGQNPHRRGEEGDIEGVPEFQVPTIQSAAAHPEPLSPENK